MGVKPSPGVLDGLYGVQLGRRPSPGDGGGGEEEEEAVRTTVVEYSAISDSEAKFGDGTTLQRLPIRRLWQHRPSFLKPVHCRISCGDKHAGETIANVVTSLPFIILGMQTPRTNLNTALYANSLVGVGIASSLYHSSKGEIRKLLRWADYTMIATTTLCLSRALRNENPRLLMAASALLLPFQPLMVSVVHTGMMEVSFAKRASIEPELRMAHNLHKMSSLLGGALFIADDCFPETPYIHAAWHLAAAIGIGTCNKLLE
ncbi:uncharacterized protein LOC127784499 [Oryza glaberrima]|uniref:uncharacterized protein LOC127784499 n=1 Tax=Oryza glaberrima TaxID=4538 RepID=UPI00224BF032|nr:uncharacterized protein LOC127784499 [Oryza glaberrima]